MRPFKADGAAHCEGGVRLPGQMPPPGSAPGFGLGVRKGKRKYHSAGGRTGEAGGEGSRGQNKGAQEEAE